MEKKQSDGRAANPGGTDMDERWKSRCRVLIGQGCVEVLDNLALLEGRAVTQDTAYAMMRASLERRLKEKRSEWDRKGCLLYRVILYADRTELKEHVLREIADQEEETLLDCAARICAQRAMAVMRRLAQDVRRFMRLYAAQDEPGGQEEKEKLLRGLQKLSRSRDAEQIAARMCGMMQETLAQMQTQTPERALAAGACAMMAEAMNLSVDAAQEWSGELLSSTAHCFSARLSRLGSAEGIGEKLQKAEETAQAADDALGKEDAVGTLIDEAKQRMREAIDARLNELKMSGEEPEEMEKRLGREIKERLEREKEREELE